MCMYIMNIGSTTYNNIIGCTKIICGEYASINEAYISAMEQSIEMVINSDTYNHFYNQYFNDEVLSRMKDESLTMEEIDNLHERMNLIILEKCKRDAFVQIYEFTIPVEKERVQKCIDKYGHNCIGLMLELEAIVPIGGLPAEKLYE